MARGARSRAAYGLALFTWSSLYVGVAAAGDFNPAGRRRRSPEPSAASRPPPSSPVKAAGSKSAGSKSAGSKAAGESQAASPAGEKQPAGSSEALITRYQAILDQDPGAEFPLERLVQLYRQRDGNLDQLLRHYEPLAARSDAAGQRARLTLAGAYVHAGDGARAEALYAALLAADPEARVPAQRLAQLLAKRGDVRGARERLAPTLKLKQASAQREEALRSLIGWSLD